MTIIAHMISAAALAEGGIAPALESRAAITMNARVLGAIRHEAKGDPQLARCLSEKAVTLEPTIDRGRYLAALLVGAVELAALERHLLALREETYDLGFTSARVKRGFDRYALDAAIESAQIAKHELAEGEQQA